MKRGRVTISDVARATGVSPAAVSLVLSDKPGVSQETRERVLEAALSMGYPVKPPASSTSRRAVKSIGLVVSQQMEEDPHLSAFYSYILTAIESTCRQMNLDLMFGSLMIDGLHRPAHIPPLLERGDVEGLLLAGVIVDAEIQRLLDRRGVPVVLLESYSKVGSYSAVLYDNFNGGYQAAAYLIEKGHRHIGFLGGHAQDYPSFRDRRAGYQQALADHNIPDAYFGDFTVYSTEREDVFAAARSLAREHPQLTGLVCVNDDTAIDAIGGLKRDGIRVPEDLSVVGFDDIEIAESIGLTTLGVNKHSMGRLAVQLLLTQIQQEDVGEVTSLFQPKLVERGTVQEVGG